MNDGIVYDRGRGYGPMPFDDWTKTWGDGWNDDWMKKWGRDEWNHWWDFQLLKYRYGF
jgi:hypothetical protein